MVVIVIMRKKSRQKTITIRLDQETWLQKNSINLSRFVQKAIDQAMNVLHIKIKPKKKLTKK